MVNQRNNTKKICFISLSAYPILAGKAAGFAGGAEKCMAMLALEFANRNFEVSFITYGDGVSTIENIGKIRLIKVYKRDDVSHLDSLSKARQLWKALEKADADIYIESPGLAGVVSVFCRVKRKRSIFYVASDSDLSKKRSIQTKSSFNFFADKLNIKLTSNIITQSEYQREILKKNYNRESTVIKNPFLLTSNDQLPNKRNPPVVIWVATVRPVKQAELFLNLAKVVPEAHFQMLGGPAFGEEYYFQQIQKAANEIPNLDFLGFIPPNKVASYLANASLMVNTSVFEGFSNTFLEAWAAYTPVVSLNADPDEIICRHKLGFHSRTFDQMVRDVNALLADRELKERMGENGRTYVEQEHDLRKIVSEYVTLFEHADKRAKH